MKLQKLVVATLLSTIVLGGIGLNATSASADSEVKGLGKVNIIDGQLKPDGNDGDGDEVDPENPKKPIKPSPDEVTPGQKGDLTILGVSVLKFGDIEIGAKDIKKPAEATTIELATKDPETGKVTGSGEKKEVGNYVQFGDIRSEKNGYSLTAELTKQFTLEGSDKTLTNTTISYTNGILTHEDAKDGIHPELGAPSMELSLASEAGATQVIDYAYSDPKEEGVKGKGIYSLEYGQTASYNDAWTVSGTPSNTKENGTEANSVFINIPKKTATNMTKGNYTAEITWTLTAAQPK